MEKILLCGNGINIQFNKKFILTEFIDLLLNTNKLKNFAMSLSEFNISYYYETINNSKDNDLDDFIFIVNKYKSNIKEIKGKLISDGVEAIFLELFKFIEKYLQFNENDQDAYNKFEKTFKILFFNYIIKLQEESRYNSFYNVDRNKFKEKLNHYIKIITLNYDSILEEIFKIDKRDIIHWHGIIKKNEDKKINFSTCLLDTIRNPKSLSNFPQIPLFKNYEKNKETYELDIIGLNPLNDTNIFALFINSHICKEINFYYHSKNDLINLEQVLNAIAFLWVTNKEGKIKLIKHKNNLRRFNLSKVSNSKFILTFNKENNVNNPIVDVKEKITINLFHSNLFWKELKNNIYGFLDCRLHPHEW